MDISTVGGFKDDKFHGHGTYIQVDGYKYEGEYRDDQPNGQGIATFGAGKFEGGNYVGEFKNGNFHGQGIHTSANWLQICR